MSLYKRPYSQFWWIQIHTPDGRRVRMSSGTADKEKAAIIEQTFLLAHGKKTRFEKLVAMLQTVCGEENPGIPLLEIWPIYTRWVSTSGKTLVPATLSCRKTIVQRFLKWTTEHWPAAKSTNDITRQVAAAFADHLAASGIKACTRKNNISDLGTVWKTLQRVADNVDNPWPLVLPHADDMARGKPYSRADEKAVLEAAANHGREWHLACLIARHTGLRYSSVSRLKWEEIDLKNGLLRHRPHKTQKHGIDVVIPLAGPLKTALLKTWKSHSDETYVLPVHAHAYPSPRKRGGPGLFSEVLKKAGLDTQGFTFHSWRHTFRTRLSEAKVSTELAKRLGGWVIDKTAERYDHAERLAELREAIHAAEK